MTIQNGAFMLFVILLSIYTFSSLRSLFHISWISNTYLVLALLSNVLFFYLMFTRSTNDIASAYPVRAILFSCLFGLVIVQVLWSSILVVDDVRALLVYLIKKGYRFYQRLNTDRLVMDKEGIRISRSLFLQWLGFGLASLLYSLLSWGIGNRYNYKIRRERLHLSGLSDAWKGLKIVQLSDIHCGSFSNRKAVDRGIRMINDLQPDIIFFTGDLVNNRSSEAEHWKDSLSRLHAPMGVFSVLGNHDYGNYVKWKTPQAKRDNLERLKAIQKEMGWSLLLNDNVLLQKKDATDAIALIGVENWSASGRFLRYGNLAEAYKGSEHTPVKVLLSHDPSHWDAEVRTKFPDIQLTLSGHTHGMQFGLETPFLKWSPVQWVYKQWAGLYRIGKQYLYVNRGFGYIGYTGRVGILPEITLFELV